MDIETSSRTLWFDSLIFDDTNLNLDISFGLNYPLSELLHKVPDQSAYVVIDGVDRLISKIAFKNLSSFLQYLRLDDKDSPWSVLISCQPEEWRRIEYEIARCNIQTSNWKLIEIKHFDRKDLDPIWKAFPTLLNLTLQPHLWPIVFKPKMLDLLAMKLQAGEQIDTTRWVGESDLIEWFWESEVNRPPNATRKTHFLESLAIRQADNFEFETPLLELQDTTILDDLIQERICKIKHDRVSFYHDIYGDWSRQRVLLSKKDDLAKFLDEKILSPLWHRALRLYSIHLLEKMGTDNWISALRMFNPKGNSNSLEQDLILDSIIFSASPLVFLERLWPTLVATDGVLLRRLLVRFLHVATLRNPEVIEIASKLDPDLEIEAATIQRIPYWPYWIPLISFLHSHLQEAGILAPKQIAQIVNIWLRTNDKNFVLRQEAAEISLNLAKIVLPGEALYDQIDEETQEIILRSALAGALDLPERVTAFALKICEQNKHSDISMECIKETFRKICLGKYTTDGHNRIS